MEYPIIKTQNYLLIVDESEIKKCTYCYDEINKRLFFYEGPLRYNYKRVVAHLPLNNSPILEGVDLLPEIEEEYHFTEEDLRQAIISAHQIGLNKCNYGEQMYNDIIQLIKLPKLPIAFNLEMEEIPAWSEIWKPTTTTTPSGQTQWVGEYIFNKQ